MQQCRQSSSGVKFKESWKGCMEDSAGKKILELCAELEIFMAIQTVLERLERPAPRHDGDEEAKMMKALMAA